MERDDGFIAVDWGTTNRRAYLVRDGALIAGIRDDRGVSSVSRDGYDAEIEALRAHFGELPVLLAGMVGSTIGWRSVPYVDALCGLADIAAGAVRLKEGVTVLPGVMLAAPRADVMRGEEVQVLGAADMGAIPPDALVVQPGTHCKWITLADRRIQRFVTAMTGELFALLRGHSILAPLLIGATDADDAFRDGVAVGTRRDLAADLFAVRAAAVLGLRDDAVAAAYTSGVLIGADVAARLADHPQAATVHILSDALLGPLYGAAIEAHGRSVTYIDSEAAFIAGMTRLQGMLT